MLSLVKGGLASIKPSNDDTPKLNAYGVQAAWRLAKWDYLENFLSQPCTEPDFEVSLGRLVNGSLVSRLFKGFLLPYTNKTRTKLYLCSEKPEQI
jgi:hypothetical protein